MLAGSVLAFEVVRHVFVGTARGQHADAMALAGTGIGHDHIAGFMAAVLDAVSVLSVAAATVVIALVALLRGRVLPAAVAAALIVGANLTTQVLKPVIDRPDLGIDPERAAAGNSLPSGHATVTASVVVALVLVVPAAVRGPVAVAGTGVAALTGVATLSAGWHRPSDAVAALLVVSAWAAAAGLVLLATTGRAPASHAGTESGGHRLAVAVLAAVGVTALAVAAVALVLTDQVRDTSPDLVSRTRLLVAYGGGAAGIAGVACAVMAAALAGAPWLAPRPVRPDTGRRSPGGWR